MQRKQTVALWLCFSIFVCTVQAGDDLNSADIAKPMRDSADKRMEVEVKVGRDDKIYVNVRLPKITLKPSRYGNLPPGNTQGDWCAIFVLVPQLNARDSKLIEKYLDEHPIESINEIGQKASGECLANLKSKEYAYSLSPSQGVPVTAADREAVQEFIDKLSSHLEATGKEPAAKVLKEYLLQY